ncbi:hypothetical protein [Pseudomonas sp. St29]|uniref:Uncharacterized protein n=1 Tax=Pseudomonas protegens TaxID=380021 RepID=A0A2T6GDP8_9PSED|nr:hypothetical protein [Pseudomonas sp. St29]PUA42271.1 hypothetical protein C5U62_27795 [Pseudomonas protegens]BAQ76119.1 putative uncharacterized protein [Pseudomonas sp. Os17]BAQ82304.1 putative uncharacterized protein [Pseudomonas sp. St29]
MAPGAGQRKDKRGAADSTGIDAVGPFMEGVLVFLLSGGLDRQDRAPPFHVAETPLNGLRQGAKADLKRRDWLENTSAVARLYTGFLQTFVSLRRDSAEA